MPYYFDHHGWLAINLGILFLLLAALNLLFIFRSRWQGKRWPKWVLLPLLLITYFETIMTVYEVNHYALLLPGITSEFYFHYLNFISERLPAFLSCTNYYFPYSSADREMTIIFYTGKALCFLCLILIIAYGTRFRRFYKVTIGVLLALALWFNLSSLPVRIKFDNLLFSPYGDKDLIRFVDMIVILTAGYLALRKKIASGSWSAKHLDWAGLALMVLAFPELLQLAFLLAEYLAPPIRGHRFYFLESSLLLPSVFPVLAIFDESHPNFWNWFRLEGLEESLVIGLRFMLWLVIADFLSRAPKSRARTLARAFFVFMIISFNLIIWVAPFLFNFTYYFSPYVGMPISSPGASGCSFHILSSFGGESLNVGTNLIWVLVVIMDLLIIWRMRLYAGKKKILIWGMAALMVFLGGMVNPYLCLKYRDYSTSDPQRAYLFDDLRDIFRNQFRIKKERGQFAGSLEGPEFKNRSKAQFYLSPPANDPDYSKFAALIKQKDLAPMVSADKYRVIAIAHIRDGAESEVWALTNQGCLIPVK